MPPRKTAADPDRRTELLDAAFETFSRFGFRKTSMDDVARDAGISRQALYAHFTDKEDLFREAMQRGLDAGMEGVDEALEDEAAEIGPRLVRAFDAWLGRWLDQNASDPNDLGEMKRTVLGPLFAAAGVTFEKKLTRAITESPAAAACKKAKTSPHEVAEVLNATARGWKMKKVTRAEFVERMTVAVRLILPSVPGR